MNELDANAKEIFLEAMDQQTPDKLASFLDTACGSDPALRARVEALLKAHRGAGNFLGGASPEQTGTEGPATERAGAIIGPYQLVEQIGEGGFGVVFRADQQRPVRRHVALKVLKPGMDTRQVVARFEAERQALALMDHPNIAHVLDGGATASGRPYFVMDLVPGAPITQYCDDHQLPPRERLALFVAVCQAVQHAHQKGIIHRDLKPSNILVAECDGKPVPKVIDFGTAKALEQRLTDQTLVTGLGRIVGTLEYMSPEQAGLNALDVDTRADIYSLGVVLYELLTGTTPLTRERLRQTSVTETLRLIREEEPPRPSTRLRKDEGGRRKDEKKTRTGSFSSLIPHPSSFQELDWIVMKCLEKDRDRRYASPRDLAGDLERYLRGEAVLARPSSARYRLTKFVRRHRAAVLAAGAVAAALLIGAGVAVWQAVVATRAQQDALTAAAAERTAKETALAKEAEARAVLDFVRDRVFAAARPKGREKGLGPHVTLRRAVEAALPFVGPSFADQPLVEARLRMTLGISFAYLGEPRREVEQFERARTLYATHLGADAPEMRHCLNNLANGYYALGQYGEALRLYEQTLALTKARFGPDSPDALRGMHNLANCLAAVGRPADALRLREEALPLMKAALGPDHTYTLMAMHNLADGYSANGRREDARTLFEQTFARMKAVFGPDNPNTLAALGNLAASYDALGRHDEALPLHQQAVALYQAALGPDHPDTLLSMGHLATNYAALGRSDESLQLRAQVLALQADKIGRSHPHTLITMDKLAAGYAARGRHEEALRLRQEALTLCQAERGANHPDTLWSMRAVAASLVDLHRGAEALLLIDRCLQLAAGQAVKPTLVPGLVELRLGILETNKDGAGCRATAELWEQLGRTDPDSLYDAARYRAVTAAVFRAAKSPDAARQAVAEEDRAMAWLKQAVAAGYKDAARLTQSEDFAALRDRPDFRELVSRLQAGR
jgi:serine/threonine protein kinase/tetratricopeptide (TPR) repeat protein